MTKPLRALFAPRSVAVVGASTKEKTISQNMLRMMRDQMDGAELNVVHPTAPQVAGVPAVSSLTDLKLPPDLVVIITPAHAVVAAVDDAIAAGVPVAVICSSGFDETGDADGARLRDELASRTDRIRILGPNCQGLYHRLTGLVATFTPSIRDVWLPKPAPIGYVGQSGAIGGAVGDVLRERGIALRSWASTGNQIDLDVVDLAGYLVETGDLRLLLLYLEDLPDGRRWARLCARAESSGVRLSVLRGGRSSTGARAVASHTGSFVSGAIGFESLCRQYNVEIVDDLDGLCDAAIGEFLIGGNATTGASMTGRGVAVLSSSGGAGAVAADLASAAGLPLAELGRQTQDRIAEYLPQFASTQNPVDVTAQLFTGDLHNFARVCEALQADPDVGAIVAILSLVLDPAAEQLAMQLVEVSDDLDIPIALVYLASRDRTARARQLLQKGGIVVFDSISRAVNALVSAGLGGQPNDEVVTVEEEKPLTSSDLSVLDEIGIPRPSVTLVSSEEEMRQSIRDLGGKAVVKLGGNLAHKTEVGAVRVGVDIDAATDTFSEFSSLARDVGSPAHIEVHQMAGPGVELLVSVLGEHNGYPPVVTVGWGGTAVELHRDTVTFSATTPLEEFTQRCRELRCWRLIEGWRGGVQYDEVAALTAIGQLASWAITQGETLRELEINPLIVHEDDVSAVDIVLGR